MIIDCISDCHGHYPKLKGGDLLIVGGDWTKRDEEAEVFAFFDWVHEQKYRKKIVIGGNHDIRAQEEDYKGPVNGEFTYLCDSGCEFDGLKIWGSPWTARFKGINPKCTAFTEKVDKDLSKHWDVIPSDIDILVTHSPPYGILDSVQDFNEGTIRRCGSNSLSKTIFSFSRLSKLKLHVFGHIHEWGGNEMNTALGLRMINASHVDSNYKPVNKPVRIEL